VSLIITIIIDQVLQVLTSLCITFAHSAIPPFIGVKLKAEPVNALIQDAKCQTTYWQVLSITLIIRLAIPKHASKHASN
jgi:hypothetical protein